MTIEIPDKILQGTGIRVEDLMLRIAIELFKEEKLTLGQASRLAGLHQMQFQQELAKRQIPIHYGVAEFEEDMRTLEKLNAK